VLLPELFSQYEWAMKEGRMQQKDAFKINHRLRRDVPTGLFDAFLFDPRF